MADITLCTGNCHMKENCYRYMASPDDYWQTYSSLEDICLSNNYSELIPYEKRKERINYTLNDFIMDEIRKKI